MNHPKTPSLHNCQHQASHGNQPACHHLYRYLAEGMESSHFQGCWKSMHEPQPYAYQRQPLLLLSEFLPEYKSCQHTGPKLQDQVHQTYHGAEPSLHVSRYLLYQHGRILLQELGRHSFAQISCQHQVPESGNGNEYEKQLCRPGESLNVDHVSDECYSYQLRPGTLPS